MTLDEAVNFYHSLERFGVRPGLERINLLCERLGSPQNKFKIIHVSGTNGKGSTCTALASVLTAAGYKTGLYTSPYVIDFRERIQFMMEMIAPEDLINVTETVKTEIEKLNSENVKITEFEAVTAAAFLYFADKKCDYAVLETGLGGRFDATNIIEAPVCSIITSVSLDHIKILGNTISEIAFEKAGIIKNNRPVITGSSQHPDAMKVIKEQACKRNSELFTPDENTMFKILNESIEGTEVSTAYGIFNIPFTGRHQLANMALVLEAVEVLRADGADIDNSDVCTGISSARIPARTEILSRQPLVILDGSHNDGSTSALAGVLNKFLKNKKIIAVMGMMADKDCVKSIGNLMPFFDEVITVMPSNPRSMKAEELSKIVRSYGVKSSAYDNPEEGIQKAFDKLSFYDVLIVCGSLYLAGDIRKYLKNICGKEPQ